MKGSCYQIDGGPLQCTPSALNPVYNSTLDALNENGLPPVLTQRLVHHLIQTPQVQIAAFTLLFLSLVLMIPALLAAHLPAARISPSRFLTPKRSKWLFGGAIFCLFWGYLLGLTASLAQKDQFSQAAGTFNIIVKVRGSEITNPGLSFAETGSTFAQREFLFSLASPTLTFDVEWVAVSFLSASIVFNVIGYREHAFQIPFTSLMTPHSQMARSRHSRILVQ
jgi:hypothetical protein